jgi:hypothetical protein
VRAAPERIVVCAGFIQGLALLSRTLHQGGHGALAVESHGLDLHWNVLRRGGLRTVPLPVDGRGARTGELDRLTGVRTVLLTPAHQFPTGVALDPDRRAAVVDWASLTDGLVLEDDYDGEFRYDRQPVGALQGLDPERVVYLGTASKSLAPGLRLAWMVVPDHLLDRLLAVKRTGERQSGALDQLTLAEFIASGSYDRHVRGMRPRYQRRRDQLVAALAERAPQVRVTGIAAGLHAVLELPPGTVLRRRRRRPLGGLRHLQQEPGGRPRRLRLLGIPAPTTLAASHYRPSRNRASSTPSPATRTTPCALLGRERLLRLLPPRGRGAGGGRRGTPHGCAWRRPSTSSREPLRRPRHHRPAVAEAVAEAWHRRAELPSVYGRFDLRYDGTGPAKLLEYNADTPTSLVEAASPQWFWMEERFPGADQWNSLHERLVDAWKKQSALLPPGAPSTSPTPPPTSSART